MLKAASFLGDAMLPFHRKVPTNKAHWALLTICILILAGFMPVPGAVKGQAIPYWFVMFGHYWDVGSFLVCDGFFLIILSLLMGWLLAPYVGEVLRFKKAPPSDDRPGAQ